MFSLVIATYNRPVSVAKLVSEINSCDAAPCQIIVIDSSDEINKDLSISPIVTYARSSHKNQPYQRYLGYLLANQEWIIYMDDDLEFIDKDFFTDISLKINSTEIVGISVGIDYQSIIQEKIKVSYNSSLFFFKIINYLSGVPARDTGKVYLAGMVGALPKKEGVVQYFNGPLMVLKKELLADCFDFVLFSLFERKLAMGEDKAISMSIGLKNNLLYLPKQYFKHPPIASHYFSDIKSFQKKVSYSRLYLSLIYTKKNKSNMILPYLHYYYFSVWRILISTFRVLVKPSMQNLQLLSGIIEGVMLTLTLPFTVTAITPMIDWKEEANNDIQRTT